MSRNASIDVIVPVYNAAETLELSLQSLADQDFGDFRVILVDDGSTDSSPDHLRRWAEVDPRFIVLTQQNAGIVAALNAGLAAADAPIVARLDADDICHPWRLRVQYEYLQANPGVVAVGGRVDHVDEHGRPLAGLPQPGDPDLADAAWIPAREPYIVHPFLMARRSALLAAGGYRHVPHSEDSDLYWRMRDIGRLHNLAEVLGQYRFHTQSISGSSVLNGRIMAIGSQLGAWAARRRAAGQVDPGFGADLIGDLREAASLEAMCRIVQPIIGDGDMAHFRLAAGIKLLELGAYRPYEIEDADCAFIRRALRDARNLPISPENRKEIGWYLTQSAARLLRMGRLRSAASLMPARLWPIALAKAVLR